MTASSPALPIMYEDGDDAMASDFATDISLIPRGEEGDEHMTGRKPPSNPVMPILYLDDNYLVVCKPFDVRMDGDFPHTVERMYQKILSESGRFLTLPKCRFSQRLDYSTSGVLIIPLSKKAAATASHQFQERTVRKTYLAIVHGWIPEKKTEVSIPIASDPDRYFRMLCGAPSNPGRSAKTTITPLCYGTYMEYKVTKVRIELGTGRRHQIRIHCASQGWPILGDTTYGMDEKLMGLCADKVPRMMLHAWRLRIRIPEGHIYGRKSALRPGAAPWRDFEAKDPFSEFLSDLRFVGTDAGNFP